MVRALICGSGLIGTLAWVSTAAAASNVPAQTAYNGQGNVQNQVAGAVAAQSGTLPFTGQSLALIVGIALLLVVAGLMLRRATRRSQ
jgi:hypothetical protein